MPPNVNPPACVVAGLVEAAALAGVDEALPAPENNEEALVGIAAVAPAPAPPKRLGLAEVASAGLAGCCPKSEVVVLGVVLPLGVVAGFAPKNPPGAEEFSAGFAPAKRDVLWFVG